MQLGCKKNLSENKWKQGQSMTIELLGWFNDYDICTTYSNTPSVEYF